MHLFVAKEEYAAECSQEVVRWVHRCVVMHVHSPPTIIWRGNGTSECLQVITGLMWNLSLKKVIKYNLTLVKRALLAVEPSRHSPKPAYQARLRFSWILAVVFHRHSTAVSCSEKKRKRDSSFSWTPTVKIKACDWAGSWESCWCFWNTPIPG